jgi:N-methylhydantoinase A
MHMAEKGRDPRAYTMIAFGGAGPVHAYGLAKLLKVSRLIVPMGAGVVSALGFLVAPPAVDDVRGYVSPLSNIDWPAVNRLFQEMEARARALLAGAASERETVHVRYAADMRYARQGFEVTAPVPYGRLDADEAETIRASFVQTYADRFDRSAENIPVEVTNWRLSASLPGHHITLARQVAATPSARGKRKVYFPGFGDVEARVFDRYALSPGAEVRGPAIFEERESSFAVEPDCLVTVDRHLNLVATIEDPKAPMDASSIGAAKLV